MKIISIANRKGGVGKTVLSANIAYELSRLGYLVIMVDLDPQSDLTKIYSSNAEASAGTIFDLLRKRKSIEDCLMSVYDNLYLIPGSKELAYLNFSGIEGVIKEEIKDNPQLDEVDFVIIDHPPALNESTLAGLIASDEVLVVSDAEIFGMTNLDDLFKDLERIKHEWNKGLHVIGLVINKVDFRRNLTKHLLKEAQKEFEHFIFSTGINYDTAVPMSTHRNIPLRRLDWHSRALTQVVSIVAEMLERMECKHGDAKIVGK